MCLRILGVYSVSFLLGPGRGVAGVAGVAGTSVADLSDSN